ncbi:hypothetical protein HanPI659440_Chr15g0611291 [Helianthus annuus]|nr:hypothetical protein HanPI659440_Chr15g0611291 [Helianthus annuus]
MLKRIRQQILSKISSFPNNKTSSNFIPRNHIISLRIIHQQIRLTQKRRRCRPVNHFPHFSSSLK